VTLPGTTRAWRFPEISSGIRLCGAGFFTSNSETLRLDFTHFPVSKSATLVRRHICLLTKSPRTVLCGMSAALSFLLQRILSATMMRSNHLYSFRKSRMNYEGIDKCLSICLGNRDSDSGNNLRFTILHKSVNTGPDADCLRSSSLPVHRSGHRQPFW